MKDRFDLEQEILKLHDFAETLDNIHSYIMDEEDPSEDTISNLILGLRAMLELHANVMFDTMCQIHKLDKYNPDENENAYLFY